MNWKRLPRTRGDRPGNGNIILVAVWAPPHTRGSTLFGNTQIEQDLGSPAHAGIDRVLLPILALPGGLPRTRGDRPVILIPAILANMAPPHTRGSTFRRLYHETLRLGSPAHAGIDLYPVAPSTPFLRLPRTRGDRPQWRLLRHFV